MLKFNQKQIETLMRDFFILTNIRIVLFDDIHSEVFSYPANRNEFCERMRTVPEFRKLCNRSDQNAFEKSRKLDKPLVYSCHAGLIEAVIPIKQENTIIGFVMFGHVLPEESESDVRSQLKEKFMNSDGSISAMIDRLICKNSDEIKAAATILEILTLYLLSNNLVMLPKAEFIQSLNEYIDSNQPDRIIVKDICTYFGIQRSQLYKISITHLGCGIAEYVRKRKILHAKELLANTDQKIAQIGSNVGFSEYNYFSHVFHEETGVSAREYRALHRST